MARRLREWEDSILLQAGEHLSIVRCFDEGATTMDLARDLSREMASEEHGLVMLETQLEGRGRRGRSWIRPRIPFTGTFITKTAAAPHAFAGLSLVVGIAVVRALEPLGAETRLKWPNDILTVDGKKLGGILIEVALHEDSACILTGIGVNIAGLPSNIEYPVASIEELTQSPVSPAELGAAIAQSFIPRMELFLEEGFARFRDEWLGLAPSPGTSVAVSSPEGRWHGRFHGITQDGALLVEGTSGIIAVHSGEVMIGEDDAPSD